MLPISFLFDKTIFHENDIEILTFNKQYFASLSKVFPTNQRFPWEPQTCRLRVEKVGMKEISRIEWMKLMEMNVFEKLTLVFYIWKLSLWCRVTLSWVESSDLWRWAQRVTEWHLRPCRQYSMPRHWRFRYWRGNRYDSPDSANQPQIDGAARPKLGCEYRKNNRAESSKLAQSEKFISHKINFITFLQVNSRDMNWKTA